MRIHPVVAVIVGAFLITALAPYVTDQVAFLISPLNFLGLP